MRHLLLGFVGAAALGLAALGPQAAQAQGFTITVGDYGGGYGPRRSFYDHDRPFYGRPVAERYSHGHGYGRPYGWGGPGYGFGGHRDCVVRVNRYFDGFSWVKEKRRICR